jgi:regulation of enolase protein 1 (concanavalin A-like superfamily)
MLVVPTLSADYTATVVITRQENVSAGLALVGDRDNAAGVELRNQSAVLWRRDESKYSELGAAPIATTSKSVQLRVTASSGYMFQFEASSDGVTWSPVGGQIDISTVPRWDRGLRVGLTSSRGEARFTSFRITPNATK